MNDKEPIHYLKDKRDKMKEPSIYPAFVVWTK